MDHNRRGKKKTPQIEGTLDSNQAVLNVADSKNSSGWLEVAEEVENRGTAISAYTQVTGTFYDVLTRSTGLAILFTACAVIVVCSVGLVLGLGVFSGSF